MIDNEQKIKPYQSLMNNLDQKCKKLVMLVEEVIKQVYEGMIILWKIVSPIKWIQKGLKGRGILIKCAFLVTKFLYEWSPKYPDAP